MKRVHFADEDEEIPATQEWPDSEEDTESYEDSSNENLTDDDPDWLEDVIRELDVEDISALLRTRSDLPLLLTKLMCHSPSTMTGS